MASNKFWQQVAEAFGTVIEETYGEGENTDAGAAFANKYNVQVSPYIPDVYSLWKEDGETFEQVWHGKTQKALLEFIKTLKPDKPETTGPKSYKVDIRAKGESSFVSNGVRLPDEEQAKRYGSDLWSRWMAADEWHVSPSDDEPNHTADEHGRLTRIASSEEK